MELTRRRALIGLFATVAMNADCGDQNSEVDQSLDHLNRLQDLHNE
jgi:hypothetical protein